MSYPEIPAYDATGNQAQNAILYSFCFTLAGFVYTFLQYGYFFKTIASMGAYTKTTELKPVVHKLDFALNTVFSMGVLIVVFYGAAWGGYIYQILGKASAFTNNQAPMTRQDVFCLVISSICGAQLLAYYFARCYYFTSDVAASGEPETTKVDLNFKNGLFIFLVRVMPLISIGTIILFMASYTWVSIENVTPVVFAGSEFGSVGSMTLAAGVFLVASLYWFHSAPYMKNYRPVQAELSSTSLWFKFTCLPTQLYRPYFDVSEAVLSYHEPDISMMGERLPLWAYPAAVLGYVEQMYITWYWIFSFSAWWFVICMLMYQDVFKAITSAFVCTFVPIMLMAAARSTYTYFAYFFACTFTFTTGIYAMAYFNPPPTSIPNTAATNKAIDFSWMLTLPSTNGTDTQVTTVVTSYWIVFIACALTLIQIAMENPFSNLVYQRDSLILGKASGSKKSKAFPTEPGEKSKSQQNLI